MAQRNPAEKNVTRTLRDHAEAVAALQSVMRDARLQLTQPTVENLDACCERLNEAASALRQLQTELPAADRRATAELSFALKDLRAEIARFCILLDGAASFHTGWMRLARCIASGYTATGLPATAQATPRVLLEI